MPATQISFIDFALSQCPWCGATGPDFDESPMPSDYCGHGDTDCTPPAESPANPAVEPAVVAHASVGGGECIPFAGPWVSVHRRVFSVRDDAYLAYDLPVTWACGGMDALRDPPSGSHRCRKIGGLFYADGYDCRVGL